jgi:exodeoxyribonuclease VII large subunit
LDLENAVELHAFNNSGAQIQDGLKQGDRVLALVRPQFWPKNGKLSMQVFEIKKVGLGELLERIEKLRAQIAAEGLSAPERKKPLPFLPNRIGLITGANSDAEKDILQNAKLRWPEVQFEVIHTHVQGDKAVTEIIFALQQLDAMPEVDVIIIARGGGSFQDLLPFSDERLVRAAAALSKPFISAIGHENDRPVLDEVADLRASTPTDAAKRVVPDVVQERRELSQLLNRASLRIGSYLETQLQLIENIRSRPVLASPYGFIETLEESLEVLRKRVFEITEFRIERGAAEIAKLHASARALSPQLTMQRGFSVVYDSNGKLVTGAVEPGEEILIKNVRVEISAKVVKVKENNG